MVRVALCALLALPSICFGGLTKTISDTQPIIDWPLCRCGKALPGVLDFALFDFKGQGELCSIDQLSFTFTMQDGDTGVGDFDYNNLTLALDDVDTGIKLNGFGSNAEPTLTFTSDRNSANWIGDSTMQQILDKLNQDGQLFASIVDHTPDDNNVDLYSSFDTTLSFTGTVCTTPDPVPEPTTILVWGVAGAALLYKSRRRKAARQN